MSEAQIKASQLAGGIGNALLGTDVYRYNHLTNGGFENWQRGNGPFTGTTYCSDRWLTSLGGTATFSISRDSVNADASSGFCAAVTYVHNTFSNIQQKLEDIGQLKGRTLSLGMRVKTSTPNAVRLAIFDSVNTYRYGSYHTGDGTYQTLTVTAPVAAGATSVFVVVDFEASCTAYLDNAMLVIGASPVDYYPLHPADDLARCLRYYQRWGPGLQAGSSYAMGQCASTTQAVVSLALRAPMGGNTALTLSAVADWAVTAATNAQVALTSLVQRSNTLGVVVDLIATTSTASLVAGNVTNLQAINTSAWLALEWNP